MIQRRREDFKIPYFRRMCYASNSWPFVVFVVVAISERRQNGVDPRNCMKKGFHTFFYGMKEINEN